LIAILTALVVWGTGGASRGTAAAAGSQETPAVFGLDLWGGAEGFPQTRIRAIQQTRDGYLWLATAGGLVRFDGARFTTFNVQTGSLRDNEVWTLTEGHDGALWAGTISGGLTCYQNGVFTSYTTADGLPDNAVRKIDEDSAGDLWIGTLRGLCRYTEGKFTAFTERDGLPPGLVGEVCARSQEGIFVIAKDKLYRWADGKFALEDLPEEAGDGAVSSLAAGRDGSLWLYYEGGVVKRLKSGAVTRFALESGRSARVGRIYEDREGTVWLGARDGVHPLRRLQNGRFEVFTPANKKESLGTIMSMYEDREGSLWLGLEANGLGRLQRTQFVTLAVDDSQPAGSSMRTVTQDSRGNIWVGTTAGFLQYRDGAVTSYTELDGRNLPWVNCIAEDKTGTLWIGAMDSLLKLRNGKLFREPTWTSKAVEIRSIYRDANDRMWVATDGNGLFLYEGDKVTVFTTQDGLASNNLRNILRDRRGAMWIATFGGGVTRYTEGRFTTYTTADGLGSNWVVTLYEARDGSLWLCTRGGLSRYANGKFFTFRAQDGLPVNFVTAIIEDDQGNFWFSCDQGIFRVKKTDFDEFAAGRIPRLAPVLYGPADGLLSTGFLAGQQSVSFRAADGRLLFPSLKGLVVVDPVHLTSNTVIPPVLIEDVTINKRPVRLGPAIEIAPGEGEVEIHYTALSFVAPAKMQFRYKLEGFDQEWVDAGTRRFAYYANLPPGRYTFQVIASNNDGVWNRTGAVVAFRLQPHFHETAWFWGVLAIILGLGILGIYRVRTAALRRSNERLERRVAERTAALAEQSTQLTKSYEELKQTQQILVETSRMAGIAEMATGILHNLGNALNSVNTIVGLTTSRVEKSKVTALGKVVQLLEEQKGRLAEFFSTDPRGQQLPGYLAQLSDYLLTERTELLRELATLEQNVDHVGEMVAAQQNYARVSGIAEVVPPAEFVEYGLRISAVSLDRHGIEVVREFLPAPPVSVERQKVLQILVNLIRNAKEAITESGRPDKRLVVGVRVSAAGRVQITVNDNGVGIAPENLTRIFNFGFTTKKTGHGFGLHSGANAAKEMGGSLSARSEGLGRGATFVLELPPAG